MLEQWLLTEDKKRIAIRLLSSISNLLNADNVKLMEKYIFQADDLLDEWSRCFFWKINEESDELFELRLRFYEKYPIYLNHYIDIKDMLQKCEVRTVRIMAFMLKEKIKKHSSTLYKYEEEFIMDDTEILLNDYCLINELLLPLLPNRKERIAYSDWDARYTYHIGIERACVQFLKKANAWFALSEPDKFWKTYEKYMYTGNDLYNEIVLDGLYHMPKEYANTIVEYLCKDFNLTIFESMSGNHDSLKLGKKLLGKVSVECENRIYALLEKKIIGFIDADAVHRLKRRIEYNKEQGYRVYWRFWGDFQRECLMHLPQERLSIEAKQFLDMFARTQSDYKSIYVYESGHSGGVSSPVSGKNISYKAWEGIITNGKIPYCNSHHWKKAKGGFIESTQDTFARSLESEISKEGAPFLEYILNIGKPISAIYIERIYSAIAYDDKLREIDTTLIEKMFKKFGYDYEDNRAMSIVRIIEKRKNTKWSEWVMSILFDIAINHKNPESGKPNVIPQDDKDILLVESIESNVINSTRSEAIQAISELIWDDDIMAERFSEPIKNAIKDENPIMRYASLFALWPIYNIDREWAAEQILFLYQQDIRMAGFHDSKNMLLRLHEKYRETVLAVVRQMFKSKDKRLSRIAGHSIAELYILHDEFTDIILDEFAYTKDQKEAVLDMLILYVGIEKYKGKAKDALLHNMEDDFKLEFPWTRLFYEKLISLNQDADFINILLSSVVGKRIFDSFLNFLEETEENLSVCGNVILGACHQLIKSSATDNEIIWGLQDDISKMIISLYDATSNVEGDAKKISMECLELWDIMYEKRIGMARQLTKKMMEL